MNQELQNNIIKDYTKGINNKKLSEKYKVHRTTIQRILIKNNIVLRKQSETSRVHNIDENYFSNINTQFKAYFMGLAYADGNLYRNCMDICLKSSDKKLLENISLEIYGKIILSNRKSKIFVRNNKTYKSKKQTRFFITSKIIANDLKKHGLIENKTFKIRLPELKDQLYKHFIRGYFDGDGCFYTSLKYKNNNRINITSNPDFLLDLKLKIENTLNIKCIIKQKTKTVDVLNIYGNKQVKKFLDWIYEESEIRLERKYQKYNNFYLLKA